MSVYDAEATSLERQAEKKEAYQGWFGGNKLDDAAELYHRAGNNWKLCKRFMEAGRAFRKAADCHLRNGDKDAAGIQFIEAAKAMKKEDPRGSVEALERAIRILSENGRFGAAASHQKSIAEMYEQDLNDIPKSIESYEKAAEWLMGEDSKSQANQCWLKVAHLAGQTGDYDKAIEKFEEVGIASLDNNLTKWSVRDYFSKATMCAMAQGDAPSVAARLDKYKALDATFAGTRECDLLNKLLEDMHNEDPDAFTQHIAEFDHLTKLDAWKTSLLLKAKKFITENEMSIT